MYNRRRSGQGRLIGLGVTLLGMLLAVLILAPGKASSPGEGAAAGTGDGAGVSGAVGIVATPAPEPPSPFPRGARIRTTDDVNLRNAPNIKGQVLMTIVRGSAMSVTDGPVEADGYRWWRVQNIVGVRQEGWMAEGAWWERLPDPTATVSPTPGATGTATPPAR